MRRNEDKHCIQCGATLPDRYKGRQRIYCSPACRKRFVETNNKDKEAKDN